MRKFNQQDLNQIKNILIALRKAKYEVQGEEILAFGQAVRWISGFHDEVEKELKAPPSVVETVAKATTLPVEPSKQKKPFKKEINKNYYLWEWATKILILPVEQTKH